MESPPPPLDSPATPAPAEQPKVSPWRRSLSGMGASLSKLTEDAGQLVTEKAEAARAAYRESEGARAFVEKSEQALERTSSAAAALSAKASEAVAEAVTAATEIEVTFAEEGPLGISFGTVGTSGGDDEGGNPKVVIGLEEEGCAARMEGCPIEVGMVIMRVQDVACEALTFAATLDLIRMASRPLTLTVRSPPAALSPRRAPPQPTLRAWRAVQAAAPV